MSQNDPTDEVLAAISSILDNPDSRREPEIRREPMIHPEPEAYPVLDVHPEPEAHLEPEALPQSDAHAQPETHPEPEALAIEEKPLAPELIEADGYSKIGPGPIASIRFKWTARHDGDGQYYVDETIGENSAPITAGPMSRDAAIQLVDDRESEAQHKFDRLRSEMTGRAAAAGLMRHDDSEI